MGLWSPNSEEEKVKRLSRKRVEPQAMGGRNGLLLTRKGEDEEIIYTLVRKAVVISVSKITLICSEYKKIIYYL
jgi:hypothetical protein